MSIDKNIEEFDIFIIGAGSGGVRCARIAASYGARVGIVERQHWGGTCVNVGCVPKKIMFYAGQEGYDITDGPGYGWDVKRPEHNWKRLIEGKDAEIKRLNKIYISMLSKSGVKIFEGDASFCDEQTIKIVPSSITQEKSTTYVRARHIVLAPGSSSSQLSIPGHEFAITSNDIFYLKERPKQFAVIGGGFIGVEFAGIMKALGSDVHLIYRGKHLLRQFDAETVEKLEDSVQLHGIVTYPEKSPRKIEKKDNHFCLTLNDGQEIIADQILAAIGRHPAIETLGLEHTHVKTEKGAVIVNEYLETSQKGIYAIGDITNKYNLTPTAIAEGHHLAEYLFGKKARSWNFQAIPEAVFFTTPLASVGLTEEKARHDHNLVIYTSSFTPMKQILPKRPGKVFMKLIVDKETDIVLGAHMVGPESSEIIQMLAIAVSAKLTKAQLDQTLSLHPTTAEEFVTMRTPTREVMRG